MQQEIPISNINDTEFTHLTNNLKVKRKKTNKRNNIWKAEFILRQWKHQCKYYAAEQFKENNFDKHNNQKINSTMSVMLCTEANFATKNSCLVTRIVLYYTVGLHLLTSHILEPCPFKDIELGLIHVIWQ